MGAGRDLTLSSNNTWRERAACRGWPSELFYPEREEDARRTEQARIVCRACTVQAECLAFAVANKEPAGIWGGLSTKERARPRGRGRPAA